MASDSVSQTPEADVVIIVWLAVGAMREPLGLQGISTLVLERAAELDFSCSTF
jgi:hypothetical protein